MAIFFFIFLSFVVL